MTKSVHATIAALFDEVEANEGTQVLAVNRDLRPLDEKRIDRRIRLLHEDFGYVLPESVRDIVLFPDELRLAWKVKGSDDPELIGEFHLENIINAIHLDAAKIPLERSDITNETRALLEHSRYFDAQPTQDWYVATVIMLDKTKDFPDLWFMDHDVIHSMTIGIEEYFDALSLTKGMYYWQYLYCEPEAYRVAPEYRQTYVRAIIETLPQHFPDHDYGPLRERLQAVEE